VVMLPDGLMTFLSGPERDSILAHELTHLRRRDNVTAAIHMAVETLFWFAPPVWLIGARLIEERERACDESVLASGHDPEVYAGGIIKVCKFCIQSPLACASGASGADLGNRVRQIMSGEALLGLTPAKRLLLAGTSALALTLPVMAGFANSPLIVQVKRQVVAVQARAQEAITAMTQQMTPAIDVAVIPRLKTLTVQAVKPPVFQIAPFQIASAPQADAAAADAAPPVAETQTAVAAPKIQPEAPAAAPVRVLDATALKQALRALSPTGEGDPDAVTCRVPQQLPGSRLAGPEICKVNRVWARLRANGQDISADGAYLITALSRTHAQPALRSGCHIIAPVPALLSGASLPDPPVQSACR
jgi:BlaR1 peptidase M56